MTTYYVDGAVGADINDGLAEGAGNAWATIQKALDTVVADDIVYVKASATYSESASASTAGSAGTPIRFIGYSSTTGDEGKVTISATGTNAVTGGALLAYYVWENFIFTGGSGVAFDMTTSGDNAWFYNCEFNNAGTYGFRGDNSFTFYRCEFKNNTSTACDPDANPSFYGCIFSGNGQGAITQFAGNAFLYNCLFYNNGATADTIASTCTKVIRCTFDGDGTSGDAIGTGLNSSNVIDSIFHDYGGNAVTTVAPAPSNGVFDHNLFSSITGSNYTTDYTADGGFYGKNDVTAAPEFADEANDDYTLSGYSPAIANGLKPGTIT